MANSDIRDFYFYQQYTWQPEDFENLEVWLRDTVRAIAEGGFGPAILSGLNATPNGGLQLSIPAGIAVNADGRPLIVPSTQLANFVSDPSNPRRSLVVLRPKDTDTSLIDNPENPEEQVPLHKKLEFEVVVISGTPAATPQYPSVQAGDVRVMGVKLAAGHTTIAQTDLDRSVVDVPRKPTKRIREVASACDVEESDDIIEVAATGGSVPVTLPTASTVPGKEFKILKIDSTDNEVVIDGQGSELISGQLTQVLDSQWSGISLYSNGSEWRVF